MQNAEIIAIGTELTSGAKLDTNSQWLSLQLADLGIPVTWHTTVADDFVANTEAIVLAASRVDLVLISGGLGPTLDDLTRQAMAAAAGKELVLNPQALEDLDAFFKSRGRPMPERNRIQAMFPEGAEMLPNPVGTAPGVWMTLPKAAGGTCVVAAMPGVPSELYKMFQDQIRPRLPGGKKLIRRARINCFGIGESHTEELLGDLTARGRDPEIGITAHEATITLRIIAHGNSEGECRQKIDVASAAIRERLGAHVFGSEDEELEDVIIQLLADQGRQLETTEIATDGQLAGRLAEAQKRWLKTESGERFWRAGKPLPFSQGSVLPGREEGKPVRSPAGDNRLLLEIGEEVAIPAMGGRPGSEVRVSLSVAGQNPLEATLLWNGNPAIFRSRTTKSALDLLRRFLQGLDLDLYLVSLQQFKP